MRLETSPTAGVLCGYTEAEHGLSSVFTSAVFPHAEKFALRSLGF